MMPYRPLLNKNFLIQHNELRHNLIMAQLAFYPSDIKLSSSTIIE